MEYTRYHIHSININYLYTFSDFNDKKSFIGESYFIDSIFTIQFRSFNTLLKPY